MRQNNSENHGGKSDIRPPACVFRPPISDLRTLRIPLTRGEFGVMNWANRIRSQKAEVRRQNDGGITAFARWAVFESVRHVITEVAAAGGNIPPGVAKEYEEWKSKV